MVEFVKNQIESRIIFIVFILLSAFWIFLQFADPVDNSGHKFFGAIYGIIAIFGMIWGFGVSKIWGFTKSVMGRALLLFSLGLFAQEFGQITLSVYDYVLHIEGHYPSLGDVGYFGSIPLYIWGVLLLAKASGVRLGLNTLMSKLQAVIIPLVILLAGYFLFLQGYTFDWSDPVKIFLDFGYPLGQAIYVSLAFLTYLLSRGILGGAMKNGILIILFALLIQFMADYTFLYQSSQGTWHVGQINDYMYLCAYFLMTLGLLRFKGIYQKLREQR